MKIEKGQRYKHYKGNLYVILATGKDSETLVDVVIYQGEYTDSEFGQNPIWVRSVQEFTETITVDGEMVSRFTRLS